MGDTHEIMQGEGGEQGDPLMPLLFSLGQHSALLAINAKLKEGESLFAFLDDLYVLCSPGRVREVHKVIQDELWGRANIQVHHGKTKVWNRAGVKPAGCDELTAAARLVKEEARVWTGDQGIPTVEQGMRVLGSSIAHPDFVQSFYRRKVMEHSTLLERIPVVPDLQSAWLWLLYCAAARWNFWIRTVPPEHVSEFAQAHDAGLWQCLCAILHVDPHAVSPTARDMATLPLSMGGLGLRSAFRLRQAAHWASWGDCLEMIRDRCPLVFDRMMRSLTSRRGEQPLSIEAARQSAHSLQTAGFEVPRWEDLAEGLRPEVPPMEDGDIYQPKHGWQHLSSKCTDTSFIRAKLVPSLSEAERAIELTGRPLSSMPVHLRAHIEVGSY